MFSPGSLRGVSQIIRRSQFPSALFTEEGEILGVGVLVDGDQVENHSSEQFFHLTGILGEVPGEGEKIRIIGSLIPEIDFQQGCGGCHVYPIPVRIDIKSLDGKVFVLYESDPWDGNPAFPGSLHIQDFVLSQIFRIISMPEFNQPV